MDEIVSGAETERRAAEHRERRRRHWDEVARQLDTWRGASGGYQRLLQSIYRTLVPAGRKVVELGCGRGDLLAALEPAVGVGVDLSPEMIRRARRRHPGLRFVEADVHELDLGETFDHVVLADLINDLWDVQAALQRARTLCAPGSRLILNFYSRLWQAPLELAERLHLAKPTLDQSWLTREDVANLLYLTDFEIIRQRREILLPFPLPLLGGLCNRVLARLWPTRALVLTNVVVARARPAVRRTRREPVVSVIVPARNEAGNIDELLARVPEMGGGTEIVFVEGHSRDDTYGAIARAIASHPERRCQLLRQPGIGKGDAVRAGFAAAAGEILMILDADLTVPPEELPRFYAVLAEGKAELVNGVRLVYPMEGAAMRLLNLLGNKAFTQLFSWLLEQPVKDTLCGTKALWKSDYELIAAHRGHFGRLDPFGDFDLLLGAARLNLKIVDMPVRYRARVYGTTNIHRWRHGWLLLRMALLAARRLKFV